MSSPDMIIEKLFEERDLNLNLLKHLDFEMMMDPTEKEIVRIEQLKTNTIEQ